MELGVAHIGLSSADEQRLKALLRTVVAERASDHRWRMAGANDANLIVFGADSEEGLSLLEAHRTDPRKVFAVLAGESDTTPPDCQKLQWPMRMKNLLMVLKFTEQKVAAAPAPKQREAKPAPEKPKPTPAPVTQHNGAASAHRVKISSLKSDIVKLASILRGTEGLERSGTVWQVGGLPQKQPLYVLPADRTFSYNGPLAELRALDLKAELEIVQIPISELPRLQAQRPVLLLQWMVGLMSAPLGLLPWLPPDKSFQIKRFPDFSMLDHTPDHRKIAAALARPRRGIDAVIQASALPVETVVGFVNASSVCGHLKVFDSLLAVRLPVATAPLREGLVKSFRKALGIGRPRD